jgi:hypothetical protein
VILDSTHKHEVLIGQSQRWVCLRIAFSDRRMSPYWKISKFKQTSALSYLSKLGLPAYKGTNITVKTSVLSVIVITVKRELFDFCYFYSTFRISIFIGILELRILISGNQKQYYCMRPSSKLLSHWKNSQV